MNKPALAAALALLLLAFIGGNTHAYGSRSTLNEGVYVEIAGHCLGVETRGTPGVFTTCDR